MFEDILDGFKDLEDELEKKEKGFTTPDPENILSLDSNDWDTGKDDDWDAGQGGSGDKIWRT